jgi:hypothetical protein
MNTEEGGCAVEGRPAQGDEEKYSCPYSVVYNVFKPGQKSNFYIFNSGPFFKIPSSVYHIQSHSSITCRNHAYLYTHPMEGSLTIAQFNGRVVLSFLFRFF